MASQLIRLNNRNTQEIAFNVYVLIAIRLFLLLLFLLSQ